jgi:hypothetical protein
MDHSTQTHIRLKTQHFTPGNGLSALRTRCML